MWCQYDLVCGVSDPLYGASLTQCVVCGAGHQYWLPKEDKVLLKRQPDHADWQSLEQRRGLSAVLQRIQWLQTSD